MIYRRFGKTNWNIGEIGYGMWGMGGWTNSDDIQSSKSLDLAVEKGVNFLILHGVMERVIVKNFWENY